VSGYRQSSYDPNAYERAGAPMRPFNWVQWTGVGLSAIGMLLAVAMIGAGLGVAWLAPFRNVPAVIPIVVGSLLINSRRHPATDPAPELAPARKRWFTIILVICAIALGAAAVIDLTGA
jgi:hypothetical protein